MNSESIAVLQRFLARSESGVEIVVCIDEDPSAVLSQLLTLLPALQAVELPAHTGTFYEAIREQAIQKESGPIIVSGLEKMVISNGYHPILQDMNLGRKKIRESIQRPLILLIPERLLGPIGRYAPDFRDVACITFTQEPMLS